jgi:L-amino acid N-acyltransferase YncA
MVVSFRFATERDAAGVPAIYAPFCESTPVSFELIAPTVEEMAQRMRRLSARFPWLVCEHNGTVAGYVYAGPHRERAAYQWSVDVTAYMGLGYRRAGVGRGLYGCLLKILALQGYFKAYAGVTLPNPGSVGLHEAVGFEPVGVYRGVGYKLGAWHDVVWLQMHIQPEVPVPLPPRGILEVKESEEVQAALENGLALVRVERLGLR